MEHYRHLVRAFGIVFILILAAYFVRSAFIPPSFGQFGPYRGDAPKEMMSATPVYQGDEYCSECHDEDSDVVADGKHVNLPCENCHFLLGPHAEGKKKLLDMPVDHSREACTMCHQYLASRPAKFPQVKDFAKHITDNWKQDMGEVDATALCGKCHKAHDPQMLKKKDAEDGNA